MPIRPTRFFFFFFSLGVGVGGGRLFCSSFIFSLIRVDPHQIFQSTELGPSTELTVIITNSPAH